MNKSEPLPLTEEFEHQPFDKSLYISTFQPVESEGADTTEEQPLLVQEDISAMPEEDQQQTPDEAELLQAQLAPQGDSDLESQSSVSEDDQDQAE